MAGNEIGETLRMYNLRSSQPIRRILIVDRATLVDLRAFIFEHPEDKVNDPDMMERRRTHTSRPALGPRLLLSMQLWVSRRPEPRTFCSVAAVRGTDSALTKWLSQ